MVGIPGNRRRGKPPSSLCTCPLGRHRAMMAVGCMQSTPNIAALTMYRTCCRVVFEQLYPHQSILINQQQILLLSRYIEQPLSEAAFAEEPVNHLVAWKCLLDFRRFFRLCPQVEVNLRIRRRGAHRNSAHPSGLNVRSLRERLSCCKNYASSAAIASNAATGSSA